MKKYSFSLIVSLSLIGTGLLGLSAGYAKDQGRDTDTYKQLNLFGDVFEKIRAQYVREITDKELVEAAIDGMLSSLDPHSSYLNAKSFDDMQVQTKGEYGGLGMEVTLDKGVVRVVSPIDDSPASRGGVQAGDYITKLDGEQVMGLTLSEAVGRMKGEVGTDIILTVIREGEKKPLEITLTRDIITLKSVRYHLEGDVGYIRVASFIENTESGLVEAIKEISKELGDDLKGIVLDMRNNPGGLLNQSIAVSSAFLERGEVVSTRTRNDEHIQRYPARKGDAISGLPLVVLINGGTASASEIVAGALQDHRRAVVVGTRSFGKGSVQTVIPLGSNGAMRLTTAYYFTPSGNSIQGEGIVPDITVEQLQFDKVKTINSRRRAEENLRGSLANPNGHEDKPESSDGSVLKKNEAKSGSKSKMDSETPATEVKSGPANFLTTPQQDYQLNYAVSLLQGIAIARHVP